MITNSDEINIFGDNKINKFGDKISWENHVDEIIQDTPKNDIYYDKTQSREKINIIKKYKSHGKLLDCGCHMGRWIDTFIDNGFDYTGVDQSEYALKIAKENKPYGKFVNCLLWNMTFQEEFDIAHFNAVLQHNKLEEQEKILPKVYQALKSNGILVMSEGTVRKQTFTQRTYEGWIAFVEKHGFKFKESWHKNPINLNDNYLFVKLKKPSITKDQIKNLLKISNDKSKDEVQVYVNNIRTFPESPEKLVTEKSIVKRDVIYMNEYWITDNNINNTISLIECIKLWRNLKVGDKCYFITETKLSDYIEQKIKNIFKECGFEYIRIVTEIADQHKLEFEKLSITKIRNWEQLRYIHKMLDN